MITQEGKQLLDLTKLRYDNYLRLFTIIQSDNSLIGDILKCHLLTEYFLEELIRFVLKENAEAILNCKLSYAAKLHVVSQLKLFDDSPILSSDTVGSLKNLNALRNKISHRIDYPISNEDLITLFNGCENETMLGNKESFLKFESKIIIRHYMAFIFGSMLPKYEKDDNEKD